MKEQNSWRIGMYTCSYICVSYKYIILSSKICI